ncbi:MAG TPA: ABC transporter permease, partial [Longimicrobiales bacterium]|nr:ABC transporter permease [Longimicrobiales bacterium]
LLALASDRLPRTQEVAVDWQMYAFLVSICLGTAVLSGSAPAIQAAGLRIQQALRESDAHATSGRHYGRVRDGLVAAQVALAFVIALGATVLLREVDRLRDVDAGMTTEDVLTMHLTPGVPAGSYYAIAERVALLPGVRAAGFTQLLPLQNWGWEAHFRISGRDTTERRIAGLRYVTPGYFRALGIPLLRGRELTAADRPDAPPVILINDALARRYFDGGDPIGVETDRGTIVGVVGDARQVGLDRPAEPELYYPAAQNVTMASDIGMTLVVRTGGGSPMALIDPVRAAVADVDPGLAIFDVRTMDQVVADSLRDLNLFRWLLGLFASVAVTLTAIGVYGVISYSAKVRSREFAVRLAVGAGRAGLARLVLARGVRLAALGLGAGAVVALALAPALEQLPRGLHADPAAYAAVAGLLLVVALAASLLPALRVTGLSPATVLRED